GAASRSSRLMRAVADEEVEEDGSEQDRALERVRPVRIPLRVDDTELHHPEHRGAEERSDDRAGAAGEQATADNGTDDEDELEPDSLLRLHRAQLERLDDPHQRSGARGQHEE